MIAKFILIVVFTGHGPLSGYATLGEYNTMEACKASAAEVYNAHKAQGYSGNPVPRFVCAAKG